MSDLHKFAKIKKAISAFLWLDLGTSYRAIEITAFVHIPTGNILQILTVKFATLIQRI
jgi:hypothetical protein